MRSAFVCVLTLLACNLWLDRRDTPCCDDTPNIVVVDPFAARWICERHLYPSYLGNNSQCSSYLGVPPSGSGRVYDRRLYPGYIGNYVDLPDFRDHPERLRRIDVRELPCETSMHASYIGNQAAWNECRRAKGLLTTTE